MTTIDSFAELKLPEPLLKSLSELGYEKPSPIQAASIPILLEGRDLVGQAQTGTGKTAAFALPMLSKIDANNSSPQLLILTPTRELAIQVAEACQSYSRYMNKCNVLPIYGGQSYSNQLRQLKRGTQIIVGTPGRVMDHIRRGTLVLDKLSALVLDEADEMLRMGFIDDVEWILEHTPSNRQIALFSATMPKVIRQVAEKYLNKPAEVKIANKTATASTIRQRYWQVSGLHKLDALTRILEVEDFDGVIIFVRTKLSTVDLADKLKARGHRCEALNGDIPQRQREQIVDKLKSSKLDILVATDVVARGLDVERISHVVNYDIPLDPESYVHRIGRTGRAGRTGDAILFVAPRERRLLKTIERTTKSPIEMMDVPSANDVNEQRALTFKQRITDTLADKELLPYQTLISDYIREHDQDALAVAAALACIAQGNTPLFLSEKDFKHSEPKKVRRKDNARDDNRDQNEGKSKKKPRRPKDDEEVEFDSYRIEVGHNDGVKPGNIVGAIANEADLDSRYIGHIKIHDNYSTVDLPRGMPKPTLRRLQKAYICGKKIDMSLK